MSGIDPNAGGALVVPGGGTALPTASAAGQVPVSAGAGSAYTATSAGDVVDAAIASVVGAVAGQAIVGDGLGGVTETSADVSAVLAAANAAAARSAISALGITRAVYDFSSGTGWTADNGTVPGASAAVTGGVARLILPTTGGTYRHGPSNYAGPSLTRDLGTPAATLDVAVRVVSLPAIGTAQLFLEISESATAGTRIAAMLAQSGVTYCYRQDVNTYDAGPTISITTDTWIRIRAEYGTVQAFHGAGTAGALPTSWTSIAVATTRKVAWRYIALGLVHAGSGVTVDADDLTIAAQELVSL